MVSPSALTTRKMAFVSDVHGNLIALDAVLAELDRLDVHELFGAGDHLLGGEAPLEVWRRLRERNARLCRGISDRALASVDPSRLEPKDDAEQERATLFAETRDQIGDLVIQQLRKLPDIVRVPLVDGSELIVVHGSPSDPTTEMGHDLSEDEVLALIGDDPADIVVCGATHVPYEREAGGVHVINVGSVGDAPEGRVAHFTVAVSRPEGTEIQQRWVEY